MDKQKRIEEEIERLRTTKISPTPEVNEKLAKYNENTERGMKLAELLKRPSIDYKALKEIDQST